MDMCFPESGTGAHARGGDPPAAVRQLPRQLVFRPREEDRVAFDKDSAMPNGPVGKDNFAPADEKRPVPADLRHGAQYKEENGMREGRRPSPDPGKARRTASPDGID
jgi:hypothetical protein